MKTRNQKRKMKNSEPETQAQIYSKWRSRTFWVVIVWISFMVISFIMQTIFTYTSAKFQMPLADIITFTGTISSLYIAGSKGRQIAVAAGAPKGETGLNNEED